MKLTKQNLIKLKKTENNKLKKYVYSYILFAFNEYIDKTAIFTDVLQHGCVSGIVSELIYTSDCVEFYEKYKQEINNILYEIMEETGIYAPCQIFDDWDDMDPLVLKNHNKNWLAWFGFEEAMRSIAHNFDELEDLV